MVDVMCVFKLVTPVEDIWHHPRLLWPLLLALSWDMTGEGSRAGPVTRVSFSSVSGSTK